MSVKMAAFWDSLVEVDMMEAIRVSETSVYYSEILEFEFIYIP
jgi:hypothetical protein